jgi:hypothetical protein
MRPLEIGIRKTLWIDENEIANSGSGQDVRRG